jgi:phenylpyruvate tautomerase
MPLLQIYTSAAPGNDAERGRWMSTLSSKLAHELGKPERYVMIGIAPQQEMSFAGSREPACYAELKNVGRMDGEQVERLSEILCKALATGLGVAHDRIYIEFTNADGAMWGFDGGTFG